MRDSFVLYTSYIEQISLLDNEQRGVLLTAIYSYVMENELPDMDGMTKMAFSFIKSQLDKDLKKYEEVCRKRREAGKAGGRPKANGFPEKQTKANGFSEKQSKHDNENEYEYEKENDLEKNTKKAKRTYTCAFETLWSAYPRKKDKALAYKAYKARLNDGFSEDELETAVKRYADECQRQRTEEKYIKHCSTFLGVNTPFMDYLRKDDQNDTGGKTGANEGYIQRLVDSGVHVDFDGF